MKNDPINVSKNRYKTMVYFICLVAALGGLLFGLDQGFVANSLETIKTVYHLDVAGSEKYSAILATGGILGALLSGIFARFMGRKKSIVFAGFIFSSASLISALLPSFYILNMCRFFLGFGVGIASFIAPLYLSETAPASIRGSMGVLFQLMITIGIFLISFTNVLIAKIFITPTVVLPLMFLVITIFAALMFISSIILPESPRWLMLKGKKQQAVKMLQKIFKKQEDVDFEIREIEKILKKDKDIGVKSIGHGYFIKILAIGVGLQLFQQFVGINVMIYYAPTIFGYAGMTGLVAMMAVPTVNMLFTFPAIRWVEKLGRKKLLYIGAVCMLITMLMAGAVFQHINGSASVGIMPKTILLLAIIGYIFGFAVSWGPVVWLVCSEIFPIKSREIGITITTIVNWTFAGILMRYSLSFMQAFGNAALFYLFAAFCILAILFVAKFVPETKGITLEELEEKLKGKRGKS
jgi:SP family galactose:H+ symporter-like MFS transporter